MSNISTFLDSSTSSFAEATTIDHHVHTELFIPLSLTLLMAVLGHFGNLNIIWATYKNKHLRSNCNLLIAMNAVVDVIHQLIHYFFAFSIFTGLNYTTNLFCWYITIVPYVCFIAGMMFIALIGVDRVICVLMPTKYNKLDQKFYIGGIALFVLSYMVVYIILTYISGENYANDLIFCDIGIGPDIIPIDSYLRYVTQALMIIAYCIMWIAFLFKQDQNSSTKRIIKSLTVIFIIILISWPGSTVYNIILDLLFPSLFANYTLRNAYFGLFVNLGVTANYYVYFIFSRDYRTAFKEQLPFLHCIENQTKAASVLGHGITIVRQTRRATITPQ